MRSRAMKFRTFFTVRGNGFAVALLAIVSALAVACGSLPSDSGEPRAALAPAEADAGSLTTILATKDLRVGTQRVSFLLHSPLALITSPTASVTTRRLDGDTGVVETKIADFHLWPYGSRGTYSTELTFDRPGLWQLEISVQDGDLAVSGRLEVEVAEKSLVPDVGSTPPPSRTKTLSNTGDVQQLTTAFTPDPNLYQISIGDAAKSNRPAVIVFATPAFCTSPTCGPQVETVSKLRDAHPGEANFIHVEIYDNPEEIQGDLSRARFAEAVEEWKLNRLPNWFNESWTFVFDSEGRIHQRFEGYVTLEELEESLQEVLR